MKSKNFLEKLTPKQSQEYQFLCKLEKDLKRFGKHFDENTQRLKRQLEEKQAALKELKVWRKIAEEKKKRGESPTIPLKLFSPRARKIVYDYRKHIKNN